MKTNSSDLTSLTGFPKLPHWLMRMYLNYPFLVPTRVKWKIATKGLGLLVSEMTKEKDKSGGSTDMAKICKDLGYRQGQKVKNEFKVPNEGFYQTLKVVVFANRLFGINSRIIEKNGNVAKSRITKCSWAKSDFWGSRPCSALSAWEIGLVQGLNPDIKIKFLKRMSKGDDCCEAEYSLTNGQN